MADTDEILVIGKLAFIRGTGSPSGSGSGGGTKPGAGGNIQVRVWLLKNALTEEEEERADKLAKTAKFLIEQQPDHMTTEYVIAIIQLDDGSFILGPIARGDANSATPDYGPNALYIGQIVGLVHNHPLGSMYNNDGTFNSDAFEANKRPSEQADGDRDGMQKIVDAKGNPNALRYYIIGPDGLMRKYPYNSPRGVNQPVMQ